MNLANPLFSPELHTLAQDFLWNADNTLAESSPFYERLARRIATDPEVLTLAAHAQPHQPAMNLLFSAVHYLLLSGVEDPLKNFYADMTREPNTLDDPYTSFRAFCLEYADRIMALVRTRRVQTNEVARCTSFMPAFTMISRRLGHQPYALIEVGSSAGLNLNWDRYAYDYNDGRLYGDLLSPVVLHCELRGAGRPPLPQAGERMGEAERYGETFGKKEHSIPERLGIDLHPNDVFDDDAMLWLRSLIWPEQIERAERFWKAVAMAREFPPRLLQGDALELAPRLIDDTPAETPVVLFHSFVLNQLPNELRVRYYDLLQAHSAGRTIIDAAIEPSAWPAPLVLTTFENGERLQETLAVCDHHGRWLEWVDP